MGSQLDQRKKLSRITRNVHSSIQTVHVIMNLTRSRAQIGSISMTTRSSMAFIASMRNLFARKSGHHSGGTMCTRRRVNSSLKGTRLTRLEAVVTFFMAVTSPLTSFLAKLSVRPKSSPTMERRIPSFVVVRPRNGKDNATKIRVTPYFHTRAARIGFFRITFPELSKTPLLHISTTNIGLTTRTKMAHGTATKTLS